MVSKEYVKGDIPEKAAILQRDGETYAIAPHIPGGIVYPETLIKIADIAEKYGAAVLKITSAQRIAIVGLKEEDLDAAWGELNLKPGAAIGPVSYTHLRAHETVLDLVCRLLLEKK